MNSRAFLLAAIVLGSAGSIRAQTGWQYMNPAPTGVSLTALQVSDDNDIWITGEYGTLLSSSNAGASWQIHRLETSVNLNDLWISTGQIWLAGDGGILAVSTDGGQGWSYPSSGVSEPLIRIKFINADHGFALGQRSTMIRTTDGGNTWSAINVSVPLIDGLGQPSMPFNDFGFANNQKGWISAGYVSPGNFDIPPSAGGWLLMTTDAGATWSVIDSGTKAYRSIEFLDSLRGWISVATLDSSFVLRTTNGGATWDTSKSDWRMDWTRMHWISALNGYGIDNEIGRTTDGGETWTLIPRPSISDFTLKNLYFSDLSHGYIVGNRGHILYTQDAGVTWEDLSRRLDIYYASFCDMSLVTASEGWLVGAQLPDTSLVLHTTDGGLSWNRQGFPHPGRVNGLSIIDATHLWAIADEFLFSTTDGGVTWSQNEISSGPEIFRDVYFRDPNVGYVVGGRRLYRTNNGGASWDSTDEFTVQFLRSIHFANDNRGWIIGQPSVGSETTFETTDGGASWHAGIIDFKSMSLVDSVNGFGMGSGSTIYRTSNGGASWSPVFSGILPEVYWTSRISFADTSVGWIWGSQTYRTTNGGVSWAPENTFGRVGWTEHGIEPVSANLAWAFGSDGKLLRFGEQIPVFVADRSSIPLSVQLHQNYPNPFNSGTIIRYSVPQSTSVLLELYNTLGQRVSVLVDSHAIAGENLVQFDASSLPSGIYIYRLLTGRGTLARKMILLR